MNNNNKKTSTTQKLPCNGHRQAKICEQFRNFTCRRRFWPQHPTFLGIRSCIQDLNTAVIQTSAKMSKFTNSTLRFILISFGTPAMPKSRLRLVTTTKHWQQPVSAAFQLSVRLISCSQFSTFTQQDWLCLRLIQSNLFNTYTKATTECPVQMRCPYYSGRVCMNFDLVLGPSELSVI